MRGALRRRRQETHWSKRSARPIDLHHVDAFVETADGLHMQVDYHIELGQVTIAMRMDEDGTGVARLTLNWRVLVEQEFVDGEVTAESTAFGAMTIGALVARCAVRVRRAMTQVRETARRPGRAAASRG